LIMEEFWKNHPLRKDRDIVLMDQRGTGASEANCINIGETIFALLKQDFNKGEETKALKTILASCKETLKQKGVDLNGYNSRENAADFENLRETLGYKKWNLFGGSYGSRLGITIMRDFPKSVRSAVLIGIFAPETDLFGAMFTNFENSLLAVLERCKKSKDCNDKFPNLKKRLLKVLKKLKNDPLRFKYDGKPFVLNSQDACLMLYSSLYDRHSIGNIPLLVEALEIKNYQALKNATNVLDIIYNSFNWPMNLSVLAYEELPHYDSIALNKSINQSEIGIEIAPSFGIEPLKNWHMHRASDFENQAVISEIPTLMVSGSLDPVTPPSNATNALKHLVNGYGIVFSDESHALNNHCFDKIAENFINNPTLRPDIACSSVTRNIEWNLSGTLQ